MHFSWCYLVFSGNHSNTFLFSLHMLVDLLNSLFRKLVMYTVVFGPGILGANRPVVSLSSDCVTRHITVTPQCVCPSDMTLSTPICCCKMAYNSHAIRLSMYDGALSSSSYFYITSITNTFITAHALYTNFLQYRMEVNS
mgnify:CR=1 FL=1